ncbi:MAG: hypothetical protein AAF733_05540 [Verrucomicrobiota bacterium]
MFHEFVGDPVLVFRPMEGNRTEGRLFGSRAFRPESGFEKAGRKGRLRLRVSNPRDASEVAETAATTLATAFYREVLSRESLHWHERRLRLDEIFRFEEASFVALAVNKLQGRPAREPWLDAWWTVRMGMAQSLDPRHRKVLILLHYDHFGEKTTTGHFCFGLRRVGGNANGDVLFDFRAPWFEDRQPRLTEAINLHNRLPLSITTSNLYDWLYTQTEYRHCYVDCWFLPVSKEQVVLLRHLSTSPVVHEAGQFRAFRKNCASLGLGLLHRLEPIGTPLPLGKGVADIPTVSARKYLENRGGEPTFVRLENVTHERGREATAKSEIHHAQPSRETSRAFRLLRSAVDENESKPGIRE